MRHELIHITAPHFIYATSITTTAQLFLVFSNAFWYITVDSCAIPVSGQIQILEWSITLVNYIICARLASVFISGRKTSRICTCACVFCHKHAKHIVLYLWYEGSHAAIRGRPCGNAGIVCTAVLGSSAQQCTDVPWIYTMWKKSWDERASVRTRLKTAIGCWNSILAVTPSLSGSLHWSAICHS